MASATAKMAASGRVQAPASSEDVAAIEVMVITMAPAADTVLTRPPE
jgi:hypothetical protein